MTVANPKPLNAFRSRNVGGSNRRKSLWLTFFYRPGRERRASPMHFDELRDALRQLT